jgi:hypothetical protein
MQETVKVLVTGTACQAGHMQKPSHNQRCTAAHTLVVLPVYGNRPTVCATGQLPLLYITI